jgi:hypothetical protein|tara:strand:+ start:5592 stop:6005 length:414 start_codon:yes stop_codon:yes gene_type:complete
MPLYLYENKETGEVLEVLQGMNDTHEYNGENESEKGLWRRVYVNPNMSTDTKLDPFSESSFRASTVGKNDTYGQLFERSAEASEMRAQQAGGIDPVKKKTYEDYSKMTNGKAHPHQMKEKMNEAIEKASKKGINIEI